MTRPLFLPIYLNVFGFWHMNEPNGKKEKKNSLQRAGVGLIVSGGRGTVRENVGKYAQCNRLGQTNTTTTEERVAAETEREQAGDRHNQLRSTYGSP